ncbi:MAG: 50S ribosomal protein L10 [Patescibacteria group bacterium]|nr:50S ribosomal protein L10 [Patescibacteria group bacterium]
MAITREKKEELIKEFAKKLEDSKAVVFTDYRGLNVEEISEIRKKLREKGIEFKVLRFAI